MIEQAYTLGELVGLPVWCEDEAGPYQAIPQPGASWQPAGVPATQPHEYIRGGTAKLLTLFRPATGEVRALPVTRSTNTVLHPWLEGELAAVLPPASTVGGKGEDAACTFWMAWMTWGWTPERLAQSAACPAPAVRLLLVLDRLPAQSGHADS